MSSLLTRRARKALRPHIAALPTRSRRASVFEWYVLLATLGFAALFWLVRRKPYYDFDVQLCRAVQRLDAPWSHRLMHWVSWPGYPPQVYALLAVLMAWLYRIGLKWEAVSTTVATIGIGAVGLAVKIFVNRPRPTPDLVRVRTSLDGGAQSFPAGHVQSFVSIIGFLAFISYTLVQRSWQRTTALATSFTLIGLIGPSRVHAGEHWPSDVLGGYFLGSIWLWVTVQVYRWGKPRFFVHQSLASNRFKFFKR